ncbi:hypothetical protein EDC65_0307 [Stella humosa]|uniref:Uncharacterized protein n=1 Tax=Stella humosa TaxID=94 RepID=A0A3N1MEI1_9PROT|nr:hypothetical protein [Stella humosa]ROQ01130.1 hypothetical protein EDC65_0307 [Stella humosa]BBK31502.1 hypothetical protein STHU_21360 [Stella humosa]
MTAPWPPTAGDIAAAVQAGASVRSLARHYGRGQTAVFNMAHALGVELQPEGRPPRTRKPDRPGRPPVPTSLAGPQPWPASRETIERLLLAGISDARAAGLFGVHPRTYGARRRKLLGSNARAGDGEVANAADYGFDPAARWPAGAWFEDDRRAVRAVCLGRLGGRPATVLPMVLVW